MTLKSSLDSLAKAFADFEIAVRLDDKTPLKNALALSESVESFATTDGEPNVIVFADINNLKFINGKYGQTGGDAAIDKVGTQINDLFVTSLDAQAFRTSGDEFIILTQEERLDEFRGLAAGFETLEVVIHEEVFTVAASFGIAANVNELAFEEIRERAETACKKAKLKGGGICVEWTEDIARTAIESLRSNCHSCNAATTVIVPVERNLTSVRYCGVCGEAL